MKKSNTLKKNILGVNNSRPCLLMLEHERRQSFRLLGNDIRGDR